MSKDKEVPQFSVRVSGFGSTPSVTKVRRNRSGGRYDGHQDVEFSAVTVRDVSFARIRFEHFYADATTFTNCDFSESFIEGTLGVLRQTTLENCTFVSTRMAGLEPGQARFIGCEFVDADIRGWSASAAEFVDCRFAGLVKQCNFWGKPTEEWLKRGLRPRRDFNEFRGNDFRKAELVDVSFVGGIDIANQVWPTSSDYIRLDHLAERIARARPVVETWGGSARVEGLLMLKIYSEAGYEDQDELFTHRWDLGVPHAIADSVWDLLSAAI